MARILMGRYNIFALFSAFFLLAVSSIPEFAHADICINTPNDPNYSATAATDGTGAQIVSAIFATINTIMGTVAQSFYKGIIGNAGFQDVLGALFLLYITIYGVLIVTNIASYHAGQVINRLLKMAFVYAMLTSATGWTFFNTYVSYPLMGAMNELITNFATAAGVTAPAATVSPANSEALQMALDSGAMAAIAVPMGKVFAAKFMIAILALLSTGFVGWLIALILMWSSLEFIFMVLGAIVTYIKSIVGLGFLFGIAPIFILFILFDKSRQIFTGWLNQVISFLLQPVLLFAFLSFYATIIDTMLDNMLGPNVTGSTATDYCFIPFMGIQGIWTVHWWRGINAANGHGGGNGGGANWVGPPPIPMIDALYMLLLCHLGKTFAKFIDQISQSLTQGIGPGTVKGSDVSQWFKNNLTGGRGRLQLGRDLLGGVVGGGARIASIIGGRSLPKTGGGIPGGTSGGSAPRIQVATVKDMQRATSAFDANRAANPAAFDKQQTQRAQAQRDDKYDLRNLLDNPAIKPANADDKYALDNLSKNRAQGPESAPPLKTEAKNTGQKAPADSKPATPLSARDKEVGQLLNAYKGLENSFGSGADKDRQEITRNIEGITGQKFDPKNTENLFSRPPVDSPAKPESPQPASEKETPKRGTVPPFKPVLDN